MVIKLLITGLDGTLYSRIGFFIPAFYDMADGPSAISSRGQPDFKREQELKEAYIKESIHLRYVIHSFDGVSNIIERINKERHNGT